MKKIKSKRSKKKHPDANKFSRRPDKRVRTYKGQRIERDETPLERQERLFGGSAELTKLARGIAEDNEDLDDEDEEEETIIPEAWLRIAAPNKRVEEQMIRTLRAKRRQLNESLIDKAPKELGSGSIDQASDTNTQYDYNYVEVSGELEDRLRQILNTNKRFLDDLRFILQPIIDIEEKEKEDMFDFSKLQSEKKSKRLTKMSREQIEASCSRYGFLSFSSFLSRLNSLGLAQKAIKGDLGNKQK